MKKSLPIFPNFEKLSLDHKEVLQAIANNFPSSDFNFAGLFTWDVDGVVMVSSLNGNLVMRSSDYLTHDKFYSFIGDNMIDETIKTLIEYAEMNGEVATLRLIPESVAKAIQTDRYQLLEDHDNHDYIYLVSDWVELKGGKYIRKRNTLHKFTHRYGEGLTSKELNLKDVTVLRDIDKVMTNWQLSRRKNGDDAKDEFIAIKKALEHHDLLGIRAFGVYHQKEMVAFLLFEILPGKVAIGHFEKANTEYEGIFIHLRNSLAKHLESLGVKTFNAEQDLGIPGLRKSKQSYHPHKYIKKFTVEKPG